MCDSSSRTSLCLVIISPPFMQLNACLLPFVFPHPSHLRSRSLISKSYLRHKLSRYSSAAKIVPFSAEGTTFNHPPFLSLFLSFSLFHLLCHLGELLENCWPTRSFVFVVVSVPVQLLCCDPIFLIFFHY